MTQLYPIKFNPILKHRPWGGNNLANLFGKNAGVSQKTGESWEISGLAGDESEIINGFLAGNTITEIIEVYMGDLVGDTVYEKYGDEFPLLIKLIDATEALSVQVHPGNEMAADLHNAYGKTEMWYVLEAEPDAVIYAGFRKGTDRATYTRAVNNGTIKEILNCEPVSAGDLFYIPAGMVHAVGGGVVLAEIQQSSDVTYRIFDWNRVDSDGKSRELHTDLAAEAINLNPGGGKLKIGEPEFNRTIQVVESPWFIASILRFNAFVTKNYNLLDSFVILLCTGGSFVIHWENGSEEMKKGETVLIPAAVSEIVLEPSPSAVILEIYMNTSELKS